MQGVNLNDLKCLIYFTYVSVSGPMCAEEISALKFVELCLGVVVSEISSYFTHTHIIQGVPLPTKPRNSLIILKPMKILQRNLNRSTVTGVAVNQLDDEELSIGYVQQDGATCHTSHSSMAEIQSFFGDRVISKELWPHPWTDLTPPHYFLWGYLKGRVYQTNHET